MALIFKIILNTKSGYQVYAIYIPSQVDASYSKSVIEKYKSTHKTLDTNAIDAPSPRSVSLALGVVGRARDLREEKQRERFENVVI